MGRMHQRRLSLAGLNIADHSPAARRKLVADILGQGIHGVSFSPYLPDQGPGAPLTVEQIEQRFAMIAPHVRWVRSFACSQGNELIPSVAKRAGCKTLVGVWLDDDLDRNEVELAKAIELANAGHADVLGVGNEVLLREELDEAALIDYIQRVRQGAPDVPVGYVDAYFKFEDHPAVTDACDVILANCYPFWEGCPIEHALLYMKEMYRRAQKAANGKPVVISETGWPNKGSSTGGAQPSEDNAIKYFIDTCQWAEQEDVPIFYFSSFDEQWKVKDEGDVGAYWGLWDQHGAFKYV